MAEYYPLLAKAIAGLPNSTPDTRRAVYERARKALLAQLQTLQPPVPEADIAHETQALDLAVARLEAELTAPNGSAAEAPQSSPGAAPMASVKVAPPATDRKPPGPPRAAPPRPPLPQRRPNGPPPTVSMGPAKLRSPETNGSAEEPVATDPPRLHPETLRSEVSRPYAPQLETDDAPQSCRLWIVIAVVVLIVGGVAAAAWKLRDRPEDLAAFKSAAQSHTDKGAGKIVERIGGGPQPQEAPANASTPAPAASPATAAAPAATTAASPAATAAGAPTTTTAAVPAQKPADSNSTVPVAYRAALLVEAPDEPNKVKTYVGTVIWQLDNVSSDSGQPPGTAVRADVDIPDDKFKASMTIQKNTDASLSASHTITIVFTVKPDSPTGNIKQISIPQLRREDNPNGEALKGILVPIMENSFLIGLSRGDAEATNLDLIKQREWFDIPILLGNGHVAKLTFEKNTSGGRAIDDALASWQAQQ